MAESTKRSSGRPFLWVAIILVAALIWVVYDMLRPPTLADQRAEVIWLADKRDLSSDLLAYLQHDSTIIRIEAALAVGRIGGREATEALLPLLNDASFDVAAAAAFAIGLTGESSYAGGLADRAFDLPTSVAAPLVATVGRLADSGMTAVHEQILALLTHPAPDVREAACYALVFAGARTAANRLVEILAGEADLSVITARLYALARLGRDAGTAIYKDHVGDADPWLRLLAIRGLGYSTDPDAERFVGQGLNDSDPSVIAEAIGALRRLGGAGAANRLLQKLQRTDDPNHVVLLFNALGLMSAPEGLDEVDRIIGLFPEEPVQAAALSYLATISGDRAVRLIDSLLANDPGVIVRSAAAAAYTELPVNAAIPRLNQMLNDPAGIVRGTALSGLLTIDSANTDLYIRTGLSDSDAVPVVYALGAIAERTDQTYASELEQLLAGSDSLPPADVDIRRSVIDVANQWMESSPNDTTAIKLLIRGTLDSDYIVRREAAEAYLEHTGTDRMSAVPPAIERFSRRELANALGRYPVNPTARVITARGEIEMELYFDTAPRTVLTFIELAERGFYDDLVFHRIVPGFVSQGGDPRGDGWGGPDFMIRDEYSAVHYGTGTVGIATSGKDTGGSQWFITHTPQPHLDARYTIFGQVTHGMDVVTQLVAGDRMLEIEIIEGSL